MFVIKYVSITKSIFVYNQTYKTGGSITSLLSLRPHNSHATRAIFQFFYILLCICIHTLYSQKWNWTISYNSWVFLIYPIPLNNCIVFYFIYLLLCNQFLRYFPVSTVIDNAIMDIPICLSLCTCSIPKESIPKNKIIVWTLALVKNIANFPPKKWYFHF